MYSIYKNQILQQKCSINPRLLNRCVDRATFKPAFDCFDYEPGMNRLCSQQPHIAVEHCDVVRRHVAFGRLALPRLYRELHSKDPIVVLQAINSVCDLVHDPEKTFDAIRLKFVNRLSHMLVRLESDDFKERILLAMLTISGQALGRQEIANRPILIDAFKGFVRIENTFNIRCKTASIIEMLSRSFMSACLLVEAGFIPIIIDLVIVEQLQIILLHLCTLETLFNQAAGQECALECGSFQKLLFMLESENCQVISKASNCLALLTSHPQGKILAGEYEILEKLNQLVHHHNRNVYTAAAEVIMFATHTVAAKHTAASIEGLAVRLLDLCHDNHPPVQMFSMKALSNMVEHPDVRRAFDTQHMQEVKSIRTCDIEELETYKEILIKLIKWKPWIG